MGNYYYLAASLPALQFPVLPDLTFESFKSSLELNLSKEDEKKLQALRLYVDILNIRPVLHEEEIDPRGNLDEKDLNLALLERDFFPQYVFDFFEEHETLAEKLKYFPALLSRFFKEEIEGQEGFLKKFFSFEREWRLVLLALRSKILKRDPVEELQFEDPKDPFVMQILSQKDSEQYEPPQEYKEIKDLLYSCGSDPWEQNKVIASYRFNKVQEMIEEKQFSMEFILAYLAQLMIIENWNELDKAKGQIILDTFKNS